MNKETILIVDDEAEVRSLMSDVLSDEGYATLLAKNEAEAISLIKESRPNLIFLDLWIEKDESAGLKILEKIQKMHLGIPVVIISGHGTIDVAVQAIQKGAFDFIEKPFVIDRLLITCKRALEMYQLQRENFALKINKFDIGVFSVGKSSFALSIEDTLNKIATSNGRVFIDTKVGIETKVIAYEIHKRSNRKDLPFVCVNCFSNNGEKFFAELFGSEKIYGYLEKADGGTIFLEDVTKLHKDCQNGLLQFLQNGTYLLKNRKVCSDARVICSSTEDTKFLIESSRFSQELFYRMNIVNINIPNLKERRNDILPLINYYLSHSDAIFGLKSRKFTEDALAILQAYDWPGNILQLKNIVESSLINSIGLDEIDKVALPTELTSSAKEKFVSLNVAKLISLQIKEAKEHFETDYLRTQIERFSGNISKTAEFIGMERSALHRKLKNLGIVSERIRNSKVKK
ncbi:MAG: sigma-54 dependent transcriptional regulator [Holosporaceae bacterium]|jgi:two-component system nitrogen regulation response regulator NtrX|nr:sigma-54 dependent transcriptional regulator [Holosporaceae bacterium]